MDVSVVVLAAGQGSRMKSSQPKVLHCLAGQPLAAHVVKVARQFTSDISLVIGHGADQVRQFFAEQPLKFAYRVSSWVPVMPSVRHCLCYPKRAPC